MARTKGALNKKTEASKISAITKEDKVMNKVEKEVVIEKTKEKIVIPINKELLVEGFNPDDYKQYFPDGTAFLPFKIQLIWFRLVFPKGKIMTLRPEWDQERNPGTYTSTARVYENKDDAVDNFLSEASSRRSNNNVSTEFPEIDSYDSVQTSALSKALKLAGFWCSLTENDLTKQLAKEEASTEETPVEETVVEETPVEETVVEETPAEETPAEETPAEETVVEETPAEETVAEETPAEETVVEETVIEETPVEETPVEETVVEETPVEETVVEETPVKETVVEETPVEETVVEETPVEETVVEETPVEETVVEETRAMKLLQYFLNTFEETVVEETPFEELTDAQKLEIVKNIPFQNGYWEGTVGSLAEKALVENQENEKNIFDWLLQSNVALRRYKKEHAAALLIKELCYKDLTIS